MRSAFVTGLHQQFGVGTHERHGHCDLCAVGENEICPLAEFFDGAEDVIPAPCVECGNVFAQFVENFIHLKRGKDRFDEHRHFDGAARNAERVLCEVEHIVPQPSFEMTLQLGQIEVRPGASISEARGIVKQIQAKVEERGGDRLVIHKRMFFRQMPAARAHEQSRRLVV